MLRECFMSRVLKRVLQLICQFVTNIKRWRCPCDFIPKIHTKDSSLANHLINRRGLINQVFRPPLLLCNGYIQTLAGLLHKPLHEHRFQREYLEMPDRGVVALVWFIQSVEKLKRSSPVLVIFPQLNGDALSVGNLCKLGASAGMRPVVFNRRGHGSSVLTTSYLTSIGDTKDVRKVMEYIGHKFPYGKIVGIGLGTGCTTLFSYLGEFGSSSLIKAAVNISPSYDISEAFYRQIPKFYDLFLLCQSKLTLLRNWRVVSKVIDLKEVILKAWSLEEFEYQVYRKIYENETVESFRQRNDPMRDVDDISVPVLCINSLDDPISVKDNIPYELFDLYPNLLLVTIEKSGHCGFIENVQGDSWADKLAIKYIENVLEFMSNSRFR